MGAGGLSGGLVKFGARTAMDSSDSISNLSPDAQEQIDTCCREFADSWKNGHEARIEDYVIRADATWRKCLLRELIEIELAYRLQRESESLTDSQICELHPALMPELRDELCRLRAEAAVQRTKEYFRPVAKTEIGLTTAAHISPERPSRGLHIRCPHCSNPVELLSDTLYDSITCRTCGSAFNLAEEDGHTAEAPTLRKLGRFELISRWESEDLARCGKRTTPN